MLVMKTVGQHATWLVFASVVSMCVVISGGCVVEEKSPSPIEEPSFESATSPGGARGAKTTTNSALITECICPLEPSVQQAESLSIECVTACELCGDGLCSGSETQFSCPFDCGSFCGDGFCGDGETSANCSFDCGSFCGDGVCNGSESSSTCPGDCGLPPPPPTPCGDGPCKNAFSVTSAQAQNRYAWGAFCREHPGISAGGTPRPGSNYLTDDSVTNYSAASASLKPYLFPVYFDFVTFASWNAPDGASTDCQLLPTSAINTTLCVAGCYPTPVCGNGACETGESSSSCSADCGPVCGTGLCESGESSSSCSAECGPVCGNSLCESGESSFSCPDDCGFCGDGLCEFGEEFSCQIDCGSSCLQFECPIQ
jgi:hypothetical protein